MSSRVNHHTLRGVFVAAIVAVAGPAFACAAQASTLPTVSVAINPTSGTVSGPLESGAANVVTKDTGVKEATEILFFLKPGVSVAEAEKFIAEKKAHKDPNDADKLGSLSFDVEVNPGEKSEAQMELHAWPVPTSRRCWRRRIEAAQHLRGERRKGAYGVAGP